MVGKGGVGGGVMWGRHREFQSLTGFYRPVNRTGSPHDELTQIQINTNSKLFFFFIFVSNCTQVRCQIDAFSLNTQFTREI